MMGAFNLAEVSEVSKNIFEKCALGKLAFSKNFDKPMAEYDKPLAKECQENLLSTYEERLQQVPVREERGTWSGKRGESTFIPNDENIKNILSDYNLDGIKYENCIPDFSPVSEATVKIDNMSENRYNNFKECDIQCAEQWNQYGYDDKYDWTPRDVTDWRRENDFTWHERNDMQTCDLVPTEINDYFGHLGGVSECKKRDIVNSTGGEFDE